MFNGSNGFARYLRAALRALLLPALCAAGFSLPAAHADDNFLPPDQAFAFSATETPGEVDVHFRIADGYYMYRERLAVAVHDGNAKLGTPQVPPGHVKFDDTFQKNVETWRGNLTVRIPVEQASGPFDLDVTSQGCADAGICYPPADHVYRVSGAALQKASANSAAAVAPPPAPNESWYERVTSADYAQSLLQRGGFFTIVGLYFVAGMVLSLLPCSYPMIPILSAIVIGEGAGVTRARGFTLSLVYVLGMSVVYTALGVVAAFVGQSLGAWLQNPWMLGAFALLLTAFALTLIAGRDLALPQSWQQRASQATGARRGGKFAAVAAMGALSALVVGACMTAPLFAVLAFIAHTGDALLGGAALFAMAIGLGVPLLIVGLGAGALLPRAGAWMDGVKVFFGVMLLAAALWIVWPVLGDTLQLALCALWLLVAAVALGLFAPLAPAGAGTPTFARRFGRALGGVCALWAATLIVGLAAGSTDPLHPLAVLAGRAPNAVAETQAGPAFAPVRSNAELDQVLQSSAQPVMLDFYADWCVSCKEMERNTFTDAQVAKRLAQMRLVRADVTANNLDDRALLKRFQLYGPPGIIVFSNGQEVARVVGYEPAGTFLRSLDRAVPQS